MSEYTHRGLVRLGADELARRFLIAERVRKHWRILAVRAALGLIDVEYLKGVCFKEILGIVPEDAHLDEQLDKVVEEMEASEQEHADILEMFGKSPRVIDLGD